MLDTLNTDQNGRRDAGIFRLDHNHLIRRLAEFKMDTSRPEKIKTLIESIAKSNLAEYVRLGDSDEYAQITAAEYKSGQRCLNSIVYETSGALDEKATAWQVHYIVHLYPTGLISIDSPAEGTNIFVDNDAVMKCVKDGNPIELDIDEKILTFRRISLIFEAANAIMKVSPAQAASDLANSESDYTI